MAGFAPIAETRKKLRVMRAILNEMLAPGSVNDLVIGQVESLDFPDCNRTPLSRAVREVGLYPFLVLRSLLPSGGTGSEVEATWE